MTLSHQEKINQFRSLNEDNYIFACHAAVPLIITPDLLYQLWNNFKQYQYKDEPLETFRISHIAVSDLLLSNLCQEVGVELYEFDKEIRDLLLSDLVMNIGDKRKNSVAKFLEDYAAVDFRYSHRKNLKDIHTLTAQSILDPALMEKQIIEKINQPITDQEKLNYLVLHHNLIPLGYESDLLNISRELSAGYDRGNVSPILIREENEQAEGVLKVLLPSFLRSRIHTLPDLNKAKAAAGSGESIKPLLVRDKNTPADVFRIIESAYNTNNKKLNLRGNSIKTIPKELASLATQLEELVLADNSIEDISGLVHCPGLKHLSLAKNKIADISPLTKFTNLEYLSLNRNLVQDIKPLRHLLKLRTLFAGSNNIHSLPDVMQLLNLPAINHLSLWNNKIDLLPISLLGINTTDNCLAALREFRNIRNNFKEPLKIYIIYSFEAEEFYQKLKGDLVAMFPGLIIKTRMSSLLGEAWLEDITQQLRAVDYVLLIATNLDAESVNHWEEFQLAKLHPDEIKTSKIIRIRIDELTIPHITSTFYSTIDFLYNYESGFGELIQIFQQKSQVLDSSAKVGHQIYLRSNSRDFDFANKLRNSLMGLGFNIKDWNSKLAELLPGPDEKSVSENSEYLLLILSPASVTSSYLEADIDFCLQNKIECIPILKAACEIPRSIRGVPFISFEGSFQNGLDTFIKTYHNLTLESVGNGPDPYEIFNNQEHLEKAHLDLKIQESGLLLHGETIKDHLLIFRTAEQHTWLVFTNINIFCLLDDLRERRTRKLIQWHLSLESASYKIYARSNKTSTGTVDIGIKKNWLYSVKLFKTPRILVDTIQQLIEKELSNENVLTHESGSIDNPGDKKLPVIVNRGPFPSLKIAKVDFFGYELVSFEELDINKDFRIEIKIKSIRPKGSTRFGLAWNFLSSDDYYLFTLHNENLVKSSGCSFSIGRGKCIDCMNPFSRFKTGDIKNMNGNDFNVLSINKTNVSLVFFINEKIVYTSKKYKISSAQFAVWYADRSTVECEIIRMIQ